jgi:hypothetical protein
MVQTPVKETVRVEDGVHTGKIVGVEERTKPFNYIDFITTVDGMKSEVKLKFGVPNSYNINPDGSPASKLAKVCKILGLTAKVGENIDLNKAIGKSIKYQTITNETDNGSFANVVIDSIKLQ